MAFNAFNMAFNAFNMAFNAEGRFCGTAVFYEAHFAGRPFLRETVFL